MGRGDPRLAEDELAAALRRGERSALRRFYDEQRDAALRTALRILGQRADAEDAVHDAFVALQAGIAGFRGRGTLAAWFFRILTRRCLELRRRRARERADTAGRLSELPGPPAPAGAALGELARALDAALGELPLRQRLVFGLTEIEGFRSVEVARILGLDAGTVRFHLFRARRALQQRLAAHRPPVDVVPLALSGEGAES